MVAPRGRKVRPQRITDARTGLSDDVRARQNRYLISMSGRTLAVILSFVLWDMVRYVAVAALVLGVVLPYLAVVAAGAGRERRPAPPSAFLTAREKDAGVSASLATRTQSEA